MDEILSETLLTLSAAAKQMPSQTGRGVNTSTVWRWAMRGIRGVFLETVLIGGVRFTSLEALKRFHRANTSAADHRQIRSHARRVPGFEVAEREWAEAGLDN